MLGWRLRFRRVAGEMSSGRILVADDETSVRDVVGYALQQEGFDVTLAFDGDDAESKLSADDAYDLLVLDIMMPGRSGLDICREVRANSPVPIILLTAKDAEVDKVVGLEVGADDYVTKPFDLRELLARVKAVLRRTSGAVSAAGAAPRVVHRFAGWQLDGAARRLLDASGHEVPLTAGEFGLLSALVEHAGRVLSRDFLLEQTRGREAAPFDRTIDVQVGRLRKKLESDPENPALIKAVRGAGYVLTPSVEAV